MRKKPCPSMMQPTNFADFNPLDVLAAAASLQRRTEENADDSEHESRKTGSGASAEEEEDTQEGGEDDDGGAADKSVNCEVIAPSVTDPKVQNGVSEEQDEEVDSVFLRPAQKCDSDSQVQSPAPVSNGSAGVMATPAPPPPLLSTEKRRTFEQGASPRTMLGAMTRVGTGSSPALASCRQQMMDHSYAFVSQLQNLKAEEDEGYSSRSSLDDDSEETVSRLNQRNGQSLIGCSARSGNGINLRSLRIAPAAASTANLDNQQQKAVQQLQQQQQNNHASVVSTGSSDSMRKQTKIVIVSKDSKLQRIISGINIGSEGGQVLAPAGSRGGGAMLRTLLGQKTGLKTPTVPQGHSKVVIAGGLSGRVINVLKSGGVSLAPTGGFPQDNPLQPEATSLLAAGKTVLRANETEKDGNDENHDTQNSTTTTTMIDHVAVDSTVIEAVADSGDTTETTTDLAPTTDHEQTLVENPADSGCDNNTSLTAPAPTSNAELDDQQTESIVGKTLEKQQSVTVSVEDSSRHGSEVMTEDETSCDSSKGDIMVDTTPVMSPSADSSTPLMSPVCERDTAIMSPMVGSPEVLCDLFKLPMGVKHHIRANETSLVVVEGQCKDININGVSTEEASDECVDTTMVSDVPSDVSTDMAEEATPPEESKPEVSSSQGELSEEAVTEGALTLTNSNSPEINNTEDDEQQHTDTLDATQHTEGKQPEHLVETNETQTVSAGELHCGDAPVDQGPPSVAVENNAEDQGDLDNCLDSETTQEGEDVSDAAEPILDVLEAQKAVTLDPSGSGSRNQYIIEDDESPVAKFGTPRTSTEEDIASSDCSSPMALAISPTSTQSAQPPLNQSETTMDVTSPVKTTTGVLEAPGSEPVKVILTADASPKSVFSAVRRPLVTGVKAIPGSLHMVPVVPTAKPGSGVMHVLPVSGARGLVTQLIPKTGGQFVTGVPVLSGKTVVLPDNGKGRMSTLLVPVSVATATPTATGAISLVQTSKVKIGSLQKQAETSQLVPETEAATPPPKLQRRDLSSPLVFHGRITPISTTSDTASELLSSPENSHQGGFSGVIMAGRQTPEMVESLRSSRKSLENSKDKISIKISSNNVMESDDSMSSEPSFSKKESIGIGMMGSLSWKSIESPAARGLTPIGTGASGGREFVRIQGGEVRTGVQASDEDSMPPLEKPKKRPGRVGKRANNKAAHPYSRKRKLLASDSSVAAPPPPPVTDQYVPQVAQLHPLIDHDYCMFTEFNAQIQSSIIATTESKTKIEKKYAKKTKAVRTKAVRGFITEESLKVSTKVAIEKVINKGRRGRLKKRRASKEKMTTDEELSLDGTEELEEGPLTPSEEKPKRVVEIKPSRTSERRAKLQALKDDKNYVKITGSYQDEFVYFATKNKRNRPRKSLEDANSQLTKQPQVGGMTVFDWYKDLSKADKTSRFGTPTTSGPSSPVPTFSAPPVEPIEIKPIVTDTSNPPTTSNGTITSTSSSTLHPEHLTTASSSYRPGATPIHESEVADLVCDLSEINSLATSEVTVPPVNDLDLSSFMIGGGQDIKTEPTSRPTAVTGSDPALPAPADIPPVSVDKMAEMAEQVREMLNSMGVDELEKLELKFGDVDPAATGMTDTSFDGLLGGFTPEPAVPITNPATTTNLCDLDEINDSDLLQSDLGILASSSTTSASSTTPSNTLKPSASAPSLLLDAHGERLPVADQSSFGFSKTLEFADVKLDKSELFPDMAPPPPPPSDVSTLAANTAPELTLVSMYWNDLPGLVLMGQQYVRLVDIHKQVLPAKDTGILKKRCQMMGLSIANCSELQRDFLVRYANAAKSKSTVIVSKEAAQTLIGFYVEPKSRPSKQAVEERGIALAEQARAQAAAARERAEAANSASPSTAKPAPVSATPPSSWTAGRPMPSATPTDSKSRTSCKGGPSVPRKRRLTGGSVSDGSPVPASPGVSPGSSDVKRSARLRHKKVCYADMLLGNHYENQDRREKEEMGLADTPVETVPNGGPGVIVITPIAEKEGVVPKTNLENRETERLYPEDIEIRKLKIKMRRKSLNAKEKRRLRRLREKVRKRELKRKLRERRKLDRLNGRKKPSVVAAAMATIAKTKRKLQETHMFNKKYNQEHCYAAAPESPDKKDLKSTGNATDISVGRPKQEEVTRQSTEGQTVVTSDTTAEPDVEVLIPVDSAEEDSEKVVVVVVDENKDEKTRSQPMVKVTKQVNAEKKATPTVQKVSSRKPSPPPKKTLTTTKRPPVAVLHRDAAQRQSQRGRYQDGQLHLDLCTERHAACIRCATCGELFSVKRFMKHMHHQNKRDELAHVTLTQTLELRAADAASAEERSIWAEFQARQAKMQGPPPAPRRLKTAGTNSSTPSAGVKVTAGVNNKTAPTLNKTPQSVSKTSQAVNKTSPAVRRTLPVITRTIPGSTPGVNKTSPAVTKAPTGVNKTSPPVTKAPTVGQRNGHPMVKSPMTNGVVTNGNVATNGVQQSMEQVPSGRGRAVMVSPTGRGVGGAAKSRLLTSPTVGRRAAVIGAKARTVGAASPLNRSPPVLQTTTPSPQPARSSTPGSTRQSTRVRKQKQLHPIEKYVFSSTSPAAGSEPPAKRARLASGERDNITTTPATGRTREVLTSPSAPVRKVRLRLSTGAAAATTTKYDLRAPPDNARQ